MITLATAATAAAMTNNIISFIDKVYNWYQKSKGHAPASVLVENNQKDKQLQLISTTSGKIISALTYQEISQKLTPEQLDYIKSFEKRMSNAQKIWNNINERIPLSSPDEQARLEAQLDDIRGRHICPSLDEIITFLDSIGLPLHDHYVVVRRMCNN
jgi:hypothetical protein